MAINVVEVKDGNSTEYEMHKKQSFFETPFAKGIPKYLEIAEFPFPISKVSNFKGLEPPLKMGVLEPLLCVFRSGTL